MSKTGILIVEDEAIVAADLTGKLGQLGYEIAGVTAQGHEAVAMACRLRPRLVLMDIQLEGTMDGIQAAEQIRGRLDIPVIYLTAHSDAATLARAKLTGPFGYILKPFEERDLATQIELGIYKHETDRQLREQREWLRVTLSSIGDAVIATDAKGCISFVNPVAEVLTGWKAEEAMGLPIAGVFRIVDEKTGQAAEDPVACVLREGRTVLLANHTALVTKSGSAIPVEDSAAPIRNKEGQVIGAVLVFHDVSEKRRAEEILAANEQRLRLALQGSGGGAWDWDLVSGEVWWSKEMYALWEVAPGTRINLDSSLALVCEKDRERLARAVEQCIARHTDLCCEYRICHLTAGERWMASHGRAVYDPSGRALRLLGITQDITRRKLSEQALKESEKRWAVTLASIGDAVIATDMEGRITFLNKVAEDLTGWPMVAAVGKPVKEVFCIVNEYTRTVVDDPVSKVLKTGVIVGLANHTVLIRKDGKDVPIDDSGAPIRDEEGRIIGAVLVFRDIGERRLVEAAQEKLKLAIEQVAESVVITDATGIIEYVNPAFEHVTGYARAEAIGQNPRILKSGKQDSAFYSKLWTTISAGKTFQARMTNQREDGRLFTEDATISPVFDPKGRIIAYVAVKRHISDAPNTK